MELTHRFPALFGLAQVGRSLVFWNALENVQPLQQYKFEPAGGGAHSAITNVPAQLLPGRVGRIMHVRSSLASREVTNGIRQFRTYADLCPWGQVTSLISNSTAL